MLKNKPPCRDLYVCVCGRVFIFPLAVGKQDGHVALHRFYDVCAAKFNTVGESGSESSIEAEYTFCIGSAAGMTFHKVNGEW